MSKPKPSGWSVFLPEELPYHAPPNAVFGRFIGLYSFLGGPVWQWSDLEGRDLKESNKVPANLVGESTRKGEWVEPGDIIIDDITLLKLKVRLSIWQRYNAESRWIKGHDYQELVIPEHFVKEIDEKREEIKLEYVVLEHSIALQTAIEYYRDSYGDTAVADKNIAEKRNKFSNALPIEQAKKVLDTINIQKARVVEGK